MRVLLTGGSGFFGMHLASFLKNKNIEVVVIGRNPCQITGVKNIIVNALIPEAIEKVLKECDFKFNAIVHLAAAGIHPSDRDPSLLFDMNTVLPSKIVLLAHQYGIKTIVMAGSSAEYADTAISHRSCEQGPLQIQKLYGATKASGGICALSLAKSLDIQLAWMRIFNIYGSGEMPHRLFPTLLSKLLNKNPVNMSTGNQIRDFVYVEDACDAFEIALNGLSTQKIPSGIYNVCTGNGHSVKEFALQIAKDIGADKALLNFGALPLRPDDTSYLVGDPNVFKNASGWVARYSFEQGIARAIEYYRAEKSGVYS